MDYEKCPHPYGTVEHDNWWQLRLQESIRKERQRWVAVDAERKYMEEKQHFHTFDYCRGRCWYCGLSWLEYKDAVWDNRHRPHWIPICTGPLSDPE
jgi:hypothetical protein